MKTNLIALLGAATIVSVTAHAQEGVTVTEQNTVRETQTTEVAVEPAPVQPVAVTEVEVTEVPETSVAQGTVVDFDPGKGTLSLQTESIETPIVYQGADKAKYTTVDGEVKTADTISIPEGQHAIVTYGTVNPPESANPVPLAMEVQLITPPADSKTTTIRSTTTKRRRIVNQAENPATQTTTVAPVEEGTTITVPVPNREPIPPITPETATPPAPAKAGRSDTAVDALLDGDPTTTSDENADIDGDITTDPGN